MSIFSALKNKEKSISITGLGYVGLPLALELASQFRVIGFDKSSERIEKLKRGEDPSREMTAEKFIDKDIFFTADPGQLKRAHFHIVTVPTPIDRQKIPDLTNLFGACRDIGRNLKPGDCVVFESTVYPGCTEEDCLPILEAESGLSCGTDFMLGYSPERINPGDREHTVDQIIKVVAGADPKATAEISKVYSTVTRAGVFKASSIKVAEAAKVIENTQRDLNIAFVNELAIIFAKMDISTLEVLEAASTKWNFLNFKPGLVGGHCIGVDPYYLLHKSRQTGYEPEVINSGRRLNDSMPLWMAKQLVQRLIRKKINPGTSKALIMGITFKENVSDIRNSGVMVLASELRNFGLKVELTDPLADPEEVKCIYSERLIDVPRPPYELIVVAVAQNHFKNLDESHFKNLLSKNGLLADLKGLYKGRFKDCDYFTL
ncbi:MAG: nucleotide sugar dehydrogenase [Saprospirales bacterium]|nr:MAG: nucleotide sugar dehydrogenase [Saprospirales bacterium]